MLSTRTYLTIGLGVGFIVFLIATFFGNDLANSVQDVQNRAENSMGSITIVIGEPIKWVMREPLFGAIACALLWPAVFIWALLFFVMLLIAFGAGAARDVQSQL